VNIYFIEYCNMNGFCCALFAGVCIVTRLSISVLALVSKEV
jgi:hypothetical protein